MKSNTVEVIQDETINDLVTQNNATVTKTIINTKQLLTKCLERAVAFNLTKAEDKATVVSMINEIKGLCSPVVDMIAPFKEKVQAELDKIRSVEKVFSTYVAPKDAPKARADERLVAWKAIDALTIKLNAYLDYEEEERRKEEARLQAEAEKIRQREVERISKKLDGIMAKSLGLNEQKKLLEEQLTDTSITAEEAEAIRQRIDAIDIKLRPVQEKIFDAQTKMEEKAAPVMVKVETQKVSGLSTDNYEWRVTEIYNIRLLAQAVADGKVGAACIQAVEGRIKAAANDQVRGTSDTPKIPGVHFERVRKTAIRK